MKINAKRSQASWYSACFINTKTLVEAAIRAYYGLTIGNNTLSGSAYRLNSGVLVLTSPVINRKPYKKLDPARWLEIKDIKKITAQWLIEWYLGLFSSLFTVNKCRQVRVLQASIKNSLSVFARQTSACSSFPVSVRMREHLINGSLFVCWRQKLSGRLSAVINCIPSLYHCRPSVRAAREHNG